MNEEKTESEKVEKSQTKMSSVVRRRPIKIIETDVDGNKLEFRKHNATFLTEGEPISINQTQINTSPHKSTQVHPSPHKSTQVHIPVR